MRSSTREGRPPARSCRPARAGVLAAALLLACGDAPPPDEAEAVGAASAPVSVPVGRAGDAPTASAPGVRPVEGIALYGTGGRFEVFRSRRGGRAAQRFRFGRGEGEWPIAGDWNGDGHDTVGVYRRETSSFHLREALAEGPEDRRIAFGDPRWAGVPIVGDWNGDGVDTPGLWVRADSSFHLTDARSTSPPDHQFVYGPPRSDWLPIVGDWNGDGRDGVGLYEPRKGVFHLKDALVASPSSASFAFGPAGAGLLPVVGDWSGQGGDRVGLYDPATGEILLRHALAAGPADETFRLATRLEATRPLAGRWLPADR